MTEQEKAQRVAESIDSEGMDYTLTCRLSEDSIPVSLREQVRLYCEVSQAILDGLAELGADPDLLG